MPESTTGSRRAGPRARRPLGSWLVIAALLAVCVLVPLLVPLYDATTPTLFGFPFYYWFQFAMIPVVSLLTYTAFRLSLVAARRDRESLGMPATPRPDAEGDDR